MVEMTIGVSNENLDPDKLQKNGLILKTDANYRPRDSEECL